MSDSNNFQETKRIRSKKFMIFTLSEERFAIPLSQVKEVIGLTTITPVPDVPAFFKGLINLRGRIISTLDLRMKLSLALPKVPSKRPCIIISELDGLILGAVVDDVVEVLGIESENIEKDLEISSSTSRGYVTGVAKLPNTPLILMLDIAKVLNIDEYIQLKQQLKNQVSPITSAA
jgi:purine-binding chemotaxis protein CheW